jgi:formylglycine-generating enzyme required for sulfatase activity
LVSTGQNWLELKDNQNINFNTASVSDNFSALSTPDGPQQSIQYRVGDDLAGGNLYYLDDELKFGDDPFDAKHSIPTTGNKSVYFNKTRDGSDFIIYGTGNAPGYPEKNLYFSSDGRLGINMPSGMSSLVKPSTVFHIVNALCKEGMRLETLTSCYPADITLYQNPSNTSDSTPNTTIAQITLAGKSGGIKKNYAQIKGIAKDSTHGQINLEVDNNGSATTIFSGTSDQVTLTNDGTSLLNISNNAARLSISGGGVVQITNNSVGISAGTTSSNINMTGVLVANNGLRIPYADQTNVLLSIDSSKNIVPATGFQIPGIVADGSPKILTTLVDGTVVASRNIDSYWPYETGNNIGGKDFLWNRYPYRVADVCCVNTATKEMSLLDPAPLAEYDVDDQIAILNLTNNTTTYRRISRLSLLNDQIVGFTLDQDITLSGVIRTYSVTKGGILTNGIYTSGIVSDASNIILSTRPRVNTVFNSSKKNINFTVYATDSNPALNVIANAALGSNNNNGTYFKFATQLRASDGTDIEPFTAKINSNGFGLTNSNNSVNFNEAADVQIWPSRVTAFGTNGRPSHYGTYDQNGNVYEWVEDNIKQSSAATEQYICGGSWRTSNVKGLRGYIPTPRNSRLDDIGFRICSKAGFTDPNINTLLGLSFVRVDDIDNPADTTPIYTETSDNRFGLKAEPSETTVINLGVVEYPYSISTNEITNNQYVVFLNSAATGSYPDYLYDTQMHSDVAGGISRSGNGLVGSPYQYYVKNGMSNMPATFITYLSALRFVNWITNGAPSGNLFNDAATEFGSYSIVGNESSITKNRDQDYWIPTLNEWHKAAYYMPINEKISGVTSAVTIKTNAPHEYASGQISSLTVGGHLYSDSLKVGTDSLQLISTINSGQYFNILLGPDSSVTDTNEDTGTESSYRSYISNTGMQFATTGNINFINKINPINKVILTPNGMFVSSKITIAAINEDGSIGSGIVLTPSGTDTLDGDGGVVPGGAFPGVNGGFAFKELTSNNLRTSDKFVVATFDSVDSSGVVTTEYYPHLVSTNSNEIIHNNDNG